MFYILSILLPPLAVIFKGSGTDFALNIFLSILGFIPGVIHAMKVVSNSKKENINS